jgi:outer membrane lipoprotein SlyB
MRYPPTFVTLCLAAGVAGCAPSYSPNSYDARAVQQANKVDQGLVRKIDISANGAAGAAIGGAAGGIAGSQFGGGALSAFTALGGTLLGGLVGTTVEHTQGDTEGYEYIVRKPNGDLLSVTQKDTTPLAIGEKVLVIAGPQARVVPDYTVPAEPPKVKPATAVPKLDTET